MKKDRKIEIELLAMDLLDKYKIYECPAKHLKEITGKEHITVLSHKGWGPEVCGKILYIDKAPVIFYNADHTEEMVNFTIAHELGHYYLKHLDNQKAEIICLERDLQKTDDERDRQEVEANFFAACLLMPYNLLVPAFRGFLDWNGRKNFLYVDKQRCNLRDYFCCIIEMRRLFNISQTAVRYRLINLNLLKFNIEFKQDEDRGISLAKYLERENKVEGNN